MSTKAERKAAASAMGKVGGKSKSAAKLVAIAQNGKRGGRPLKSIRLPAAYWGLDEAPAAAMMRAAKKRAQIAANRQGGAIEIYAGGTLAEVIQPEDLP